MSESPDESHSGETADASEGTPGDATGKEESGEAADEDARTLRRRVDEEYDFEEFGPADMARMTGEEWEAAFDDDSWITGPELLDRVEDDLRSRVAARDVFAVVERDRLADGERLVAYSDEGYAVVYEDGTVEGRGTVLRDVKPSVALASMDSYDVPEPPEGDPLPEPAAVPERSGELGNRLMLVVAAVQVLAGLFLLGAWIVLGLPVIAAMVGFAFLLFGGFLFLLVANARLSDRFRAEEFRERLRAAGVDSGERPPFVPGPGEPLPGGDDPADGSTPDPDDGAGDR